MRLKIILIVLCIFLIGCKPSNDYSSPKCLVCGCEEGFVCIERGTIGYYCVENPLTELYTFKNLSEENINSYLEWRDNYCEAG